MIKKGKKVTSLKDAKIASRLLRSRRSSRNVKSVAGSDLSQRETRRSGKTLKHKRSSGVRVSGRPPIRHKRK